MIIHKSDEPIEHEFSPSTLLVQVIRHACFAFASYYIDPDFARLPESMNPMDGLIDLFEAVRGKEGRMGTMLEIEPIPKDDRLGDEHSDLT